MHIHRKIEKFCKDNRYELRWFAKKIGMSDNTFYNLRARQSPFPHKYWKKIIEVMDGKITLEELAGIGLDEESSSKK